MEDSVQPEQNDLAMTEKELEKRVNTLNAKINEARKNRNLFAVAKYTAEMNNLKKQFITTERTNMKEALDKMDVNTRMDLFRKIQRIELAADFLDTLITDFRSDLKSVDPYLKGIFLDNICEHGKAMSKFIKVTVDDFGNEDLSEDFANLADTLKPVIMNEIYKHEAIILKRHKNEKNAV